MVTEAHIEMHTPNGVIPFWFVWSFIFACLLGAVLYLGLGGYAYGLAGPDRTPLNIINVALVGGLTFLWFVGGNVKKRDSMAKEWTRYKEVDRIGYQLVFMLNSQGELDNRLERRDHQNAQLNTSTYALYVQLGGKRPRLFVGKKHDASPFIGELDQFRVSQVVRGESVLVQGRYSRLKMPVFHRTLLKTLNETDGELGFSALNNLLSKLSAERYHGRELLEANQKSATLKESYRADAESSARHIALLKEEIATLEKRLGDADGALQRRFQRLTVEMNILSEALDVLGQVVAKSKHRSTRLSDLGRFVGQKLTHLKGLQSAARNV